MNNYSTFKGTEESILELIKPFGFDICPVCREIVIYNSYVAVCGHKFCDICINKLIIKGTLKKIRNIYDDCDDSDDNNSLQYIQEYKCPICRKTLINMPLRLSEIDLDYKESLQKSIDCLDEALKMYPGKR